MWILRHSLECEKEHRRIFKDWLENHHIRRCISYHFCGLGGFALGLITGLIGPNAVYATTYAVETVVLEHLEDQLIFLNASDKSAANCVAKIVADEKAHRDNAAEQMSSEALLTRSILYIVKFSTHCVIRFGMR